MMSVIISSLVSASSGSDWQSLQLRNFSTNQAASPMGIRQCVGEAERLGRLDRDVGGLRFGPSGNPRQVVLFLGAQGRVIAADGRPESCRHIVEVQPEHPFRM